MFMKRVLAGLSAGLLAAVGAVTIPTVPDAAAIGAPDFGSVEELDLGGYRMTDLAADEAAGVVYVMIQATSQGPFHLKRVTADGTVDWSRPLYGTKRFGSVEVGPGGDIWVTARTSDSAEVQVRRFTPEGVELWRTALGGSHGDWCGEALAVDSEGNSYCGGSTFSADWASEAVANGAISTDSLVVKIDPDGNEVWAKGLTDPTIVNPSHASAAIRKLAITPNGKLFAFGLGDHADDGHYTSNGTSLVVLDAADGSQLSAQQLNVGESEDNGFHFAWDTPVLDVEVSADGNSVWAVGAYQEISAPLHRPWVGLLWHFDADGVLLGRVAVPDEGGGASLLHGVEEAADGGLYVTELHLQHIDGITGEWSTQLSAFDGLVETAELGRWDGLPGFGHLAVAGDVFWFGSSTRLRYISGSGTPGDPSDPLDIGGTTTGDVVVGSFSDPVAAGHPACVVDATDPTVQACFETNPERDQYLTSAGILDGSSNGKTTLGTHYLATSNPRVGFGPIDSGRSLAVVGLSSCVEEIDLRGTDWDDVFSSTRNGCPAIAHYEHYIAGPGPGTGLGGLVFISEDPGAYSLGAMSNQTTGIRYLPAAVPPVTDGKDTIKIVVIGDSFSAGNGSRDASDDRTYYGAKGCYRSSTAYSEIYAQALRDAGLKVTLLNRACSGGVIQDFSIARDMETRQVTVDISANPSAADHEITKMARDTDKCSATKSPDEFYGDFSIVERFGSTVLVECHRKMRPQRNAIGPDTDLVLFTFGGNDLGFSDIAKNCLVLKNPGSCRDDIKAAVKPLDEGTLQTRVEEVLTTIRDRSGGEAKIAFLGYPHLEGS